MATAAECQVLFEMFASPRGKTWLGRLGISEHAGRIVLLRELAEGAKPRVEQAVRVSARLKHPQLLKVLGVVSDQHRRFVASEYIPGVSLFELIAAIRRRQRPMATAAAVRVILDALRLVGEGRALLEAAAAPPVRLVHADCIWIAEFGETLLAEAGVSGHLAHASAPDPDSEAQDVMTAAIELFHLASGRLMTGDMRQNARMHLSAPLAKVLDGAFSGDPASTSDFAAALSAMPAVLLGTEASVAEELRRLVADLLDERRAKLAALHGGSPAPDIDSPTRVFSAPPNPADDDADEPTHALPVDPQAVRAFRQAVRRELSGANEPPTQNYVPAAMYAAVADEPPPAAPIPVRKAARRHLLLERLLLVLLLALVATAGVLAVGNPTRVRLLVQQATSLF